MSSESAAAAAGAAAASASGDPSYAGCAHYRRRVQLQCPKCLEFFACRFCHDAEKNDNLALDPKLQHALDRRAVALVRCMPCGREQAPAQACAACGAVLGAYFCGVCRLYDDVDKGQFHCEGCGICRVGGRANFAHCARCETCVPAGMAATHACLAGAMRASCAVCQEDMFSSRRPSAPLRCGHYLHTECTSALLVAPGPGSLGGVKRCPLCQASAEDASALWRAWDVEVLLNPMPAEARPVIRILCNDCHRESTVRWHCVGNKCAGAACGGYNTRTCVQGARAPGQPLGLALI